MAGHVRQLTRCALLLLAMAVQLPAFGDNEIAVIVGADAADTSLDPALLRDIFLRKIFLDDGGHPYVPVNLPPDNPLRRSLADVLFNKSARELQDYWNQRYFQGITPPYVLDSQEAVIQFVARTPGAIGYIAACLVDARIRQVLAISAPAAEREALKSLCDDHPRSPRPE
jgi:ABC-type phosphate transport system substrate-binding protein